VLPVYRLLLRTLLAHDLEQTAECLRREANLGDDEQFNGGGRNLTDSPEVVPGSQEMLLHRCRAARAAQRDTRQRVERCTEEMMAQQRRLENLKASIRSLRDQAEPPTVELQGARLRAQECQIQLLQTECAEYVQLEDTMRDQLSRKDSEIQELQRRLDLHLTSENELREQLKDAQKEIRQMVGQKKQAMPTDEASMIRAILASWDAPGGPRLAAQQCFAEVDRDHDGRLEWNNDEIRHFCRQLFGHLL